MAIFKIQSVLQVEKLHINLKITEQVRVCGRRQVQ